jgi:hypothetical protein
MQTHGEGLGIFSAKLRERSTGYEIIGQGGDGVDHGYDSSGDVVTALRGRSEALTNALHGELIACIQGTQAAVVAGVGRVVIETDALAVVQAAYSEDYAVSDVFSLVEELRSLSVWNFISWSVQQCPRSCNRVAHE